jgi:hypothetical protein
MTQAVIESLPSINLTASGIVGAPGTRLLGFFVNSVAAGDVTLYHGLDALGDAIGGIITPTAIGFYPYPAICPGGLYAEISATIDLTFFFDRGN